MQLPKKHPKIAHLPRGIVRRRPEHRHEALRLAEVVGGVPRVPRDLVAAATAVGAAPGIEALEDEVVGAGEGVVGVLLRRLQVLKGLVAEKHLPR